MLRGYASKHKVPTWYVESVFLLFYHEKPKEIRGRDFFFVDLDIILAVRKRELDKTINRWFNKRKELEKLMLNRKHFAELE